MAVPLRLAAVPAPQAWQQPVLLWTGFVRFATGAASRSLCQRLSAALQAHHKASSRGACHHAAQCGRFAALAPHHAGVAGLTFSAHRGCTTRDYLFACEGLKSGAAESLMQLR